MATAGITVAGLKPDLNILGQNQQFIFGSGTSPSPTGSFKLDNIYLPIIGIPSITNLEFRNKVLSGFRWQHITNNTDTYGTLKLKKFLNEDPVGTDVMVFNDAGDISFNTPITFNGIDTISPLKIQMADDNISALYLEEAGSTKGTFEYVKGLSESRVILGSSTALTLQCFNSDPIHFITAGSGNIDTATLDNTQFRSAVNFISDNIASDAIPQLGYLFSDDGVNKAGILYNKLDDKLKIRIGDTDCFNVNSDLNIDLLGHKITSSGDPTGPQDLVTKSYLESIVSSGSITLDGSVTGTGNIGTTITTNFHNTQSLPFSTLNFKWSGNPSTPYIFTQEIDDGSPFFKEWRLKVTSAPPDVMRSWNAIFNLGDPNAWNPTFSLEFKHPIFSPSGTIPLQLINIGNAVSPLWGLYLTAKVDMGGFEIVNALDPTTPQSLTTKSFVTDLVDDYLPLIGGTLTGDLILNGDPTNPLGAVTKQYADGILQGMNFHNACYAGTTTNLNATYSNGVSGVGAILTNNGTLETFALDGIIIPVDSRVLIKNQTSSFQNGIYVVSNTGSNSIAWVLTRDTDYNSTPDVDSGDFVLIENGTINTRTAWIETAQVSVIGTDPIIFSSFGNTGTVTNVTGTTNQISVLNSTSTPTISISSGYVGQTSINTLGTIASGTWNAGVISPTYGGTGVNNNGHTITCAANVNIGSNFTTIGSFATNGSFNTVGAFITEAPFSSLGGFIQLRTTVVGSNVTLPESGTLVNDAVTTLSSLSSIGTVTTGSWQASNIGLNKGGTNASLTGSNGGIVYSTDTALGILSGTPNANKVLLSGSSTAPSWSSTTYPNTTTANQILYSSANNVIAELTTSNNSILTTNGSGVPSFNTILPFTVTVGTGGTGRVGFTPYSLICGGTTTTGTLQTLSSGTSGQVLTSSGGGNLPTWQTLSSLVRIYEDALYNLGVGTGTFSSTLTNYENTALGVNSSFSLTDGGGNTSVGKDSMYNATTSSDNVSVGFSSSYQLTTGSFNTVSGRSAAQETTTGSYNTVSGYSALLSNIDGIRNSAFGANASILMSIGNDNTVAGYGAGSTRVSYDSCCFFGKNADASVSGLINASAFGSNAVVSASNCMVLGSGANIGIGISAPLYPLDVVGSVRATNFIGAWAGTTIPVSGGGTGATSFSPYALICGGTTNTNPLLSVPSGTAGYVLTYVNNTNIPIWKDNVKASALLTLTNNAIATTLTTGGTFYKIAGVTASSDLYKFISPASNRATYTGTDPILCQIHAVISSVHSGGGGDEVSFIIYKNGTVISKSLMTAQQLNNLQTVAIITTNTLVTNDYIEVWCSHPTSNRTLTAKNMHIYIQQI